MEKQKKQAIDHDKKIKVSTLIYSVLIILIVVIAVLSILAYGTTTKIGGKISANFSRVIPFPAAIIDWRHIVFMKDVEKNMASVEKFYKVKNFASEGLRVDFTTEEGGKRLKIKEREVLDKMVEDQIIEILAKERGISITDVDAENVVNQRLNEFGTADDVKQDLLDSYGWDIAEFKKRVVIPGLYADALALKVASENSDNSKSKAKINQAVKELEAGKDFSQVVRTYSEGTSSQSGGELGWVKKEQVLPELQTALFGDQALKKNNIIESSIGFHIVEIENSKKTDGVTELQLRQVFVSKNTFADWLQGQKKQVHVSIPLKGFTWNAQTGAVDFRDNEMIKFEIQQREKSQGDASIML
jgi:peptidyl-prolyl cis-trans isomerase C